MTYSTDDRLALEEVVVSPEMEGAGFSADDVRLIASWIGTWADEDGDLAALAATVGVTDPESLWSPVPLANQIAQILAAKATRAARG